MKLPRLVRQIGKRVVNATPFLRRHILTSTDYRVLGGLQEARDMTASSGGWLAARTVARQERAYRSLIAAMKRGEPRLDFRVAAEAIAATGLVQPRLLEVGCGSGYYADVFAALLPGGVRYTGVDYSNAMIARARARAPATAFEVADATRLPYADGAFDIVFNGVSLMHIIDYQARSARPRGSRRVIASFTPCRCSTTNIEPRSCRNTLTARRWWKSSSASRTCWNCAGTPDCALSANGRASPYLRRLCGGPGILRPRGGGGETYLFSV